MIGFFQRKSIAISAAMVALHAVASANPLRLPNPKGPPPPSNQVENIPIPAEIKRPSFTEVALTLSTLTPQGESTILGSNFYALDQVGNLPVISAHVQHWAFKDFERQQNMGFIFGTSLSDKKVNVDLKQGNSVPNVNIIYFNLRAGLSWQQSFLDEQLSFGLSGIISQDLWQQNTSYLESQWSRWVPAIGLMAQGKWWLNLKWYTLAEVHNQWPLQDNQIDSSNQRFHFGFGYSL